MNRPKACVVVFPGSNCDRDAKFALDKAGFETEFVWHEHKKELNYDLVFIPGGFSYGDYLRAGALATFSPVMDRIREFVSEKKGLVLGVCNGFQILTESGLLPGALTQNNDMKFRCEDVTIKVINKDSPFTFGIEKEELFLPIANAEGRYVITKNDYEILKSKNRIAFEYSSDINGSVGMIAGVFNESFNVLGMMPHPERNSVKLLGNGDGLQILLSIRRYIENG